ncbi:DUF2326 domain-containing protein [Cucumibacter marinus]|uniref:DUF2326 domain-containing protein n=1 Tax=Cucumibacter marinus TaxID=1121252 RepID=UPI00041491C6|nr:DUF2326 domain-containing protein [Cucumibacter marinus]
MAPADLFAPHFQPPTAPNGRREPRLWVRRLALFEDPKTLKRDIPLKPGLNIVWTPDMSSSGQSALAHGSGKTTFCRLLRACLGEPAFATDSQGTRLMAKLPNGLVAAEVIVDEICWIAVRNLGLGSGSFVAQADSIEDVLARGRQEGDAASLDPIITRAFFSALNGRSPQEVGDEHIWDVLRAWLSRDQECRLGDILAWRTSKTQTRSRAQVLSETAKLTMVRLALRALDAEEQRAAARERELANAADEERKIQAYGEQRRAEKLGALRNALGVGEDVELDDTLDQKGLVALAETALAEAMRAELPTPPDVSALLDRLADLNTQRAAHVEDRQTKERDAERKRREAEHLRSEASVGEIDISQGRIRVCTICRVPIDQVLAQGCGISLERCDVAAIKAEIAEKQRKAANLDQEAEGAETEAKRIAAAITQIDQEIRTAEEQAKGADAALRAAQQAAANIQDRVYQARRLLDDARTLRQSSATAAPTSLTTDDLETVRAQLEQGRKRAQQAIQALEDRYRGIMSAWLPEGVDGAIKLDGKGLKVDAQFSGRGEVSTAALDSLKIVAFDLAALHLAVEEKADLPAFLIHDSPREADLDGTLYARLFELVQGWEDEAGSACFQYIVTTTTAPPKKLQNDQYVRQRMSSTPAEQRLFRMDL